MLTLISIINGPPPTALFRPAFGVIWTKNLESPDFLKKSPQTPLAHSETLLRATTPGSYRRSKKTLPSQGLSHYTW